MSDCTEEVFRVVFKVNRVNLGYSQDLWRDYYGRHLVLRFVRAILKKERLSQSDKWEGTIDIG